VEPAGADRGAQSLVRAGGGRQSAAGGVGPRLKLNYITQAKARPPSFILFCSRADAVPQSYLRYLVNSLREFFELPGTPVRIALREKANPFAHKRKRPS
jgi:GTP-binding protein